MSLISKLTTPAIITITALLIEWLLEAGALSVDPKIVMPVVTPVTSPVDTPAPIITDTLAKLKPEPAPNHMLYWAVFGTLLVIFTLLNSPDIASTTADVTTRAPSAPCSEGTYPGPDAGYQWLLW